MTVVYATAKMLIFLQITTPLPWPLFIIFFLITLLKDTLRFYFDL